MCVRSLSRALHSVWAAQRIPPPHAFVWVAGKLIVEIASLRLGYVSEHVPRQTSRERSDGGPTRDGRPGGKKMPNNIQNKIHVYIFVYLSPYSDPPLSNARARYFATERVCDVCTRLYISKFISQREHTHTRPDIRINENACTHAAETADATQRNCCEMVTFNRLGLAGW